MAGGSSSAPGIPQRPRFLCAGLVRGRLRSWRPNKLAQDPGYTGLVHAFALGTKASRKMLRFLGTPRGGTWRFRYLSMPQAPAFWAPFSWLAPSWRVSNHLQDGILESSAALMVNAPCSQMVKATQAPQKVVQNPQPLRKS